MAIFFELLLIFSYLGSRPTMADKILRRTSYGGEQTENISKFWPLKATISRRHFLVTFYFQSFQIPWFKSIGKIKRLVLNLNFSWKLQFFRGRKLCGILSDFIINKSQVIYKYLAPVISKPEYVFFPSQILERYHPTFNTRTIRTFLNDQNCKGQKAKVGKHSSCERHGKRYIFTLLLYLPEIYLLKCIF